MTNASTPAAACHPPTDAELASLDAGDLRTVRQLGQTALARVEDTSTSATPDDPAVARNNARIAASLLIEAAWDLLFNRYGDDWEDAPKDFTRLAGTYIAGRGSYGRRRVRR